MNLQGAKVAFSFDDAPRMGTQDGVRASVACMDAVREALAANGVRSCVAFVIGVRALGEESALERWLAAGYELGNHSWSHRRASTISVEEFLGDFVRCDAFLRTFPAFAAAPRHFMRFPSLDSGRDQEARARLARAVRELGYTILPGSVDVFDHRFEARLSGARAAAVAERWIDVATRSLAFEHRRTTRVERRAVPHLHYGHFGALSEHHLARLLARWKELGVVACDVAEAVADPFHQRYLALQDATGRVPCVLLGRGLGQRFGHAFGRWSERLGLFGQRDLGPLWPYLE